MREAGLVRREGAGLSARWVSAASFGLATLALLGCGSDVRVSPGGSGGDTPGGVPGEGFAGVVRGAGQPVAGAAVMLYGAGAGGNGTGAEKLLAAAVSTAADGSFTIPAGYRCVSSDQQLYLVARGGSAGGASGALAEMTALGACGDVGGGTEPIVVNEATTVAAVWALRPFLAMDGRGEVQVGATATNAVGLGNAVAMAHALVGVRTGAAPGPELPSSGTAPVAKVNTLASLLALCAADAGTAACRAVLGSNPDTMAAAVAIANAPGQRVAELFAALRGAAPAVAPVLTAAPPDWTLAMTYRGGGLIAPTSDGLTGPTAVALDAQGRAWVTNYGGVLSVFGPTGTPVFADGLSGGGMGSSYALALDASGNAWVTNTDPGTVTEWSGTGALLSGASGYGAGDHPLGVAIAADGTVWIADNGNASVAKLSSAGAAKGIFTVPGLAFPQAVAVDGNGGLWVGNGTGMTLTHMDGNGGAVARAACCNGIAGLALDEAGSVWAANYFGNSVSRVDATGAVDPAGPYTATGLVGPQGIAVDGAGAVWVASLRAPGVQELAGARASSAGALLSPPSGWATDAGLDQATGLAIDASGDVWISNFAAGTVTELVGVAAPVRTPLLGLPRQP